MIKQSSDKVEGVPAVVISLGFRNFVVVIPEWVVVREGKCKVSIEYEVGV